MRVIESSLLTFRPLKRTLPLNTGLCNITTIFLEAAGTMIGVSFTAELGFEQIVFTLRKDGAETERHTVKPEDIQSFSIEPDGSTRLAVRFRRDLVIPASRDESMKLQIALQRLLGEVKAVELRKIEADREARTKMEAERGGEGEEFMEKLRRMRGGRFPPSREDYEKIPDD